MKEKIYTIPINEAYDEPCGCPMCTLERRLEEEACEYAVGAAMMELDFRVNSNEKGFCSHHIRKIHALPNKLSLALVLDTGVADIGGRLAGLFDKVKPEEKSGLFKKSGAQEMCDKICAELEKYESSCVICEKVEHTMDRYYGTLADMWATEEEFRAKFERAQPLCLPHLLRVLQKARKRLSAKDLNEFLSVVGAGEKNGFSKLGEDIHRFTLKFDYRNRDMEWGDAKDAPRRAIETLCGYGSVDGEEQP